MLRPCRHLCLCSGCADLWDGPVPSVVHERIRVNPSTRQAHSNRCCRLLEASCTFRVEALVWCASFGPPFSLVGVTTLPIWICSQSRCQPKMVSRRHVLFVGVGVAFVLLVHLNPGSLPPSDTSGLRTLEPSLPYPLEPSLPPLDATKFTSTFDKELLSGGGGDAWRRAIAALKAIAREAANADGDLLVSRPRNIGAQDPTPTRRRPSQWVQTAAMSAELAANRAGPAWDEFKKAATRDGTHFSWREWIIFEKGNVEADAGFGDKFFNDTMSRLRVGGSFHYGGDEGLYDLANRLPERFRGKHWLIPGSQTPVYEIWLIHYAKAARTTTLDYRRLTANYAGMEFGLVAEYWRAPRVFDCALSYSNFEHDGLGRYGDPIDPDGDVKAFRELWTMLRSKATLVFASPVGPGQIAFNAHRHFGVKRLARLWTGWKLVAVHGMPVGDTLTPHWWVTGQVNHIQPIFVLERQDDPDGSPVPSMLQLLPWHFVIFAGLDKMP